jgi:SAM-dependent MidA family methyltransferase
MKKQPVEAPERYPLPSIWKDAFDQIGDGQQGISIEAAVGLVLYQPTLGYYQKPSERVGKGEGSDFYTTTSLGPLWYELIFEAVGQLLGQDRARQLHFVEVGAEPYQPLPQGTPFLSYQRISLGEDFNFSHKPCVLFANELLDAQPFRQFRWHGEWLEWGVFWDDDHLWEGPIRAVDLLDVPELQFLEPQDGDCLDLSTGAIKMADHLGQIEGVEALCLCDYGRDLKDMLQVSPQGTHRAYYRHQLKAGLWENLGYQDITHHIAWDLVAQRLTAHGFRSSIKTQEAFFMHHAMPVLKKYLEGQGAEHFKERQALKALLHPLYFGQKFQILFAKK